MRAILVCCFAALCAVGCDKSGPASEVSGAGPGDAEVRPPTAADLAEYTKDVPGTGGKLIARIETSLGTLTCELFTEQAPMTVANFVGLATGKKAWRGPSGVERNKPFYDGLVFHRVIPGFMIQGGDPTGTGRGGPGYQFADELDPNTPSAKAGYIAGTVAMANAGPNTNGSQFFIMHKDVPLPHAYTIFGKVISGIEAVDAIAATPRDASDRPLSPIKILKATVVENK